MIKYITLVLTLFGVSGISAIQYSQTYNNGRNWYHSDGSTTATYNNGKTWYHSDGSTANTYDNGKTWHYTHQTDWGNFN